MLRAALKGFEDPFTIRYLVGLGGGPVQEVNLPYVSTLGPPAVAGEASTAGQAAVRTSSNTALERL
jgi:hypothetical protein